MTMYKLLSANFLRLRKSKVFWGCLVLAFAYAVAFMLNGCRQALADTTEYVYFLDQYYFHFALSMGAFVAVLGSMLFASECSEGALRNKIIVGHTKAQVYLANLLCTFAAALLLLLAWGIGGLIGVPVLGWWKTSADQLLVYLLITVLFMAALCSLFTFVQSLSPNGTVAAIACLCLFAGLFIFSGIISNALAQPEMTSGVIITSSGMSMGEPEPNPEYVSGAVRAAYEFIADALPTGQGLQVASVSVTHPARMMMMSVVLSALITLCGVILFRKKDLK